MEKPKRKNQLPLWRKRHIQALFIFALFSVTTLGMAVLTAYVTPHPTYDLPYVDPTITPDWYCDIGPTSYDRDNEASALLQSSMDEAGLTTVANVWYHLLGYGEVICVDAPPSAATWGRSGVIPEVIFYVNETEIDNPEALGAKLRTLSDILDTITFEQEPYEVVVYFVHGETTKYWRTRRYWLDMSLNNGATDVELYEAGRYPYDRYEGLPRYQNQ